MVYNMFYSGNIVNNQNNNNTRSYKNNSLYNNNSNYQNNNNMNYRNNNNINNFPNNQNNQINSNNQNMNNIPFNNMINNINNLNMNNNMNLFNNNKDIKQQILSEIKSLIQPKNPELAYKQIFQLIKDEYSYFGDKLKNYNDKNIERKGSKIIINFYDKYKKEFYLDLELKVEYLISYILTNIKYDKIEEITYKRIKNDQNTKYVVENPLFIFDKSNSNIDKYSFIMEYKGRNLFTSLDETGTKIGLKNEEEIYLKLNKYYIIKNYESKVIDFKVNFKYRDENKIPIKCNKNTLLLKVIKGFLDKTGNDYESVKEGDILFEYNGEILNDFNKTLFQLGIFEETEIEVKIKDDNDFIEECFSTMNFVNVSPGNIKERNIEKFVEDFKEGLNIFGECLNEKCDYYKKEVTYSPKLNEKLIFVLNKEKDNIKCRFCNQRFDPETCGFWKCEYQFCGKYINEGNEIDYNSEPKETVEDIIDYFDKKENGIVVWSKLIIYVLPIQTMKYKSNS